MKIIEKYNQELKREQLLRMNTESNIDILKKKLKEKKIQIDIIRNPRFYNNDAPKSFLASEKLASNKKQGSLSPIKNRPESTSRKKQRVRSSSRNS